MLNVGSNCGVSNNHLILRDHVRPKFSTTPVDQSLLQPFLRRRIRFSCATSRNRKIRNRWENLVSKFDRWDPGTPFTDAIIREASYTLACYLQDEFEFDPPSPFSKSRRTGPFTILELGSGTGVVAANLSAILSSSETRSNPRQITGLTRMLASSNLIIATDLENVCPLLQENLVDNAPSSESASAEVLVRPLAWGNQIHTHAIFKELSDRRLTHIICSDLVCYSPLLSDAQLNPSSQGVLP